MCPLVNAHTPHSLGILTYVRILSPTIAHPCVNMNTFYSPTFTFEFPFDGSHAGPSTTAPYG